MLTLSSPPIRATQVLRTPPPPRQELPQEEVRTHQPAPPQEEAEVETFSHFISAACTACMMNLDLDSQLSASDVVLVHEIVMMCPHAG